jgi:hypothetical protein
LTVFLQTPASVAMCSMVRAQASSLATYAATTASNRLLG